MANESAKKIVKANAAALRKALIYAAIFLSLHLIGLWFSEASTIHWAGAILFIAINGGCLGFFKISATAVYDGPNNIVSAGTDLSQKGLIEFLWDMLYSSWFCEVAVLLTPWLWLAMLLMPAYGIYKLISLARSMGGLGGAGQGASQDESDQPTKRSRATKDAPKVKYAKH